MTISQRLLWTLVPNGTGANGKLRATVTISPRLSIATNDVPTGKQADLSYFPDWKIWPRNIADADFSVLVDGQRIPATRVRYRNADLDPDAWQALFPSTTLVQPYDFADSDLSGKRILSYPVATIARTLRQSYGQLAAATSNTMPSPRQIGGLFGDITAALISNKDRLLRAGDDTFGILRGPIAPIAAPSQLNRNSPGDAMLLHSLYLHPLEQQITAVYEKQGGTDPRENVRWRTQNLVDKPTADEVRDSIDFHRIVSSLSQYSELLRLTGLVVDIEFARQIPDGDHTLQLAVNWPRSGSVHTDPDVRPRIAAHLEGDYFWARPDPSKDTELTGRFLRLRDLTPHWVPSKPVNFDVVEGDVDGGGVKFNNFLLTSQIEPPNTYDDETDDSVLPPAMALPSLRSAGLMLANHKRDLNAAGLFDRSATLQKLLNGTDASGNNFDQSEETILYAEDVVRGYRADIFDQARNAWFRLNARNGTYTLRNTGRVYRTKEEEGMVRMSAVSSADGTNPDILKVHEAVFSWKGWSLSAPQPGNALQADVDASKPDGIVGDGQPEIPDGLPLDASFTAADQSLPSLRFGRTYAMRVRVADLAGESEAFSDTQPPEALSPPVTYRRFEPIESPSPVLVGTPDSHDPVAEGESMGRFALRSLVDSSTDTVQARRHIVAPRVGHRFAEAHGVMDVGGKINPDPLFFQMLGQKDNALDEAVIETLGPPVVLSERDVRDCLSQLGYNAGPAGKDFENQKLINALRKFQKASGIPDSHDLQDRASAAALAAACNRTRTKVDVSYSVAPDTFDLPYLPDPWAIGVALKISGVEGIHDDTIYPIPLYDHGFNYANSVKDWPNARPFKIVIADTGATDPSFDAQQRIFQIPLAKAERGRIRVSSIMPIAALEFMAVWQMIRDQGLSDADLAPIGQDALRGQHWMLTPWRVLEVVHAVQKPLITPQFPDLVLDRLAGWVYALPSFTTPLHAKSTQKVDTFARWQEPEDRPGEPLSIGDHHAHAYEIKLSRQSTPNKMLKVGPRNHAPIRPKHTFGDTRYRRVTYQMEATTRFREFMPTALLDDPNNLKVVSDEVRAWVPSASPPPAPKIVYIVPTFGWARNQRGPEKRSLRSGGGIRVYLDRPWFQTGFTEMLGVVLPPPGGFTSPEPSPALLTHAPMNLEPTLSPFVTQWGADPIWATSKVGTVAPPPGAFPLARWRAPITFDGIPAPGFPAIEGTDLPPGDFKVTGLRTPEMPDPQYNANAQSPLSVAPHAVGYDADRDLWYADIVVRPGAVYFPFIRLALARYNPVSIEGAHLSSVVMAEFVQLAPDRLAIVTQNGDVANVAVHGWASTGDSSQGTTQQAGIFDIEWEVLDPGADEDLGWRPIEAERRAPPAVNRPTLLQLQQPQAPQMQVRALDPSLAGQAQELIDSGNFMTLLSRPDLVASVQPPLLWQGGLGQPTVPVGARLRLVITESEAIQTGEPGEDVYAVNSRVVYVETVEITANEFQQPTPPPPPPTTPPPQTTRPPRPTLPPATTQPPYHRPQAVLIPNFSGDWTGTSGIGNVYDWHLDQDENNQVTGTYMPLNAEITEGTIDANGRLHFTWTEYQIGASRLKGLPGAKTIAAAGRGYLDLTPPYPDVQHPNILDGRWWVGDDNAEDDLRQRTQTWHLVRKQALQPILPKLNAPLLKNLLNNGNNNGGTLR